MCPCMNTPLLIYLEKTFRALLKFSVTPHIQRFLKNVLLYCLEFLCEFFLQNMWNLIFYMCCNKSHSKNQYYELFIVCKFENCKASHFLCSFLHSLRLFSCPSDTMFAHKTSILSQNCVVIKTIFSNSPRIYWVRSALGWSHNCEQKQYLP